jgi:putative SOS response-associated peptidase YedK
MCGRFSQNITPEFISNVLGVKDVPSMQDRFNIAPSQKLWAARQTTNTEDRELVHLKWGLIPSWAKDASIGTRQFNARSETVAEKPSFRAAFKQRRCLIPASGFIEWEKLEDGKQPYYFHMKDKEPFSLAGIWEQWVDAESQQSIESCTILTTEANKIVGRIHDRMPVIIPRDYYGLWLQQEVRKQEQLQELLVPYPADEMDSYQISKLVNSFRNDTVECIEPLNSK